MNQTISLNEKTLALLQFSLDRNGVNSKSYKIGKEGDEARANDQLCLLQSGSDAWVVLYAERGSISERSVHSTLNDAAKDFYWRLTNSKSHWADRADWEKATGDVF